MGTPVEITNTAMDEIKNILNKKGIPREYGLRMSIRGGHGCSGVNFTLGFDTRHEKDISYKVGSLEILIKKSEMMHLIGKKVDFYEGSDARGFIFIDSHQPESSTLAR